jgi:hypothetical protein
MSAPPPPPGGGADTFPLPPQVLKNLSDKSFEKRKAGAQEVEKIVRRMRETEQGDAIRRVLSLLATDFACNVNSNNRKGGLIGLASCAIGLMAHISEHLDVVVPAVLKSFSDQEPRVRYYACESLFNIVKICRCGRARCCGYRAGCASAPGARRGGPLFTRALPHSLPPRRLLPSRPRPAARFWRT